MRANDPRYELGLTFGGHPQEDKFWAQTLPLWPAGSESLSQSLPAKSVCVDRPRQWRNARHRWHNAMIRSMLQTVTRPFSGGRRRTTGENSAPHE